MSNKFLGNNLNDIQREERPKDPVRLYPQINIDCAWIYFMYPFRGFTAIALHSFFVRTHPVLNDD